MRSGTKASTRNAARPIGGAAGSARTSTLQAPTGAAGGELHRQIERGVRTARRRRSWNTWPLGRLDGDMRRAVRPAGRNRRAAAPSPAPSRPAGRCRGQARRRHRAARDRACPPRRDRPGRTRRCRDRARRNLVRAERVDRPWRHRPLAVQQRGGEPRDAVGVGGGLGQDVVVRRDQRSRTPARGSTSSSRAPARSARRCRATGRRQIGAQDHLHRAVALGVPSPACAVSA